LSVQIPDYTKNAEPEYPLRVTYNGPETKRPPDVFQHCVRLGVIQLTFIQLTFKEQE